jgi:hypothetical protein
MKAYILTKSDSSSDSEVLCVSDNFLRIRKAFLDTRDLLQDQLAGTEGYDDSGCRDEELFWSAWNSEVRIQLRISELEMI